MKDLSPVMFEDFVKPFQINLEEVFISIVVMLVDIHLSFTISLIS